MQLNGRFRRASLAVCVVTMLASVAANSTAAAAALGRISGTVTKEESAGGLPYLT
jgi:hypothetical protein